MKKIFLILIITTLIFSCNKTGVQNSDEVQKRQTETLMNEANRQIGMPGIINFQEKKNLKWIYELCDKEDFICHAYLFNEFKGEVGQYLGECIGYGIPYSTQFSNPEKMVHDWGANGRGAAFTKQAEPNGLFKPEGLSATWLIMIDPKTKEPRPVYVEPSIIVSPFKLK
jgi:hypothetical protein